MTLIEVACAAALLIVAVAGLSQVAVTSDSLRESGVEKGAATRAIQERVAAIEATDFAALQATFGGAAFDVLLDGATQAALPALAGDADGRAGSIAVTAPTGDPAELLEVVVRVDWNGRNGPQSVARTLRLSRVGSGS